MSAALQQRRRRALIFAGVALVVMGALAAAWRWTALGDWVEPAALAAWVRDAVRSPWAPLPIALMGLNEGVNTFIGEDGKLEAGLYVPAYVRRYPFMLARLKPDSEDLSLCFDPTAENIGEFEEGQALFENGEASEGTKQILEFCEQFEHAGQRTQNFMKELKDHDLLMDGEISITQQGNEKPFVYRGFQMINQDKLRELRGDQLRKWTENGLLPLIWAQIFSMDMMRTIFGRQLQQGKVPLPDAATAGVPTA